MFRLRHIFTLLLLFMVAQLMGQTPQETTINASHRRYVTPTGAYSNRGTTWADAKNNIQDAINDLVASHLLPGEVWVKEGTYRPTESTESGGSSLYASFKIPAGITVRGGFAGNEVTLNDRMVNYLDENGKSVGKAKIGETFDKPYTEKRFLNPTILTGDLSSRQANFTWNDQSHRYATQFYGNAYHVVWFATNGFDSKGRANALQLNDDSWTATLEGMIIKRGYAYNSSLEGHPHNAYGGGAYMVKGSMMRDVWIECCEASRNGGAVYMDGGGVCDHVYVTTSQAQGIGTSYGYGGGVCIETNPAISDVAPVETGFRYGMIANCAARQGGGLAILTSRNTFTETYTNPVTGQQETRTRVPANYEDQRNKAYAYASIVAHNVALIEGGGIYTSGGGAMSQMTIVGNACYGTATIVNGVTQGRSGGLYSSDKVTVHNSVLCGNYAMSNNGIQYATSRTSISEDLKALMEYCRVENNDVTDWSSTRKVQVLSGANPAFVNPHVYGIARSTDATDEFLMPFSYRVQKQSPMVNSGLFSANLDKEGLTTNRAIYPFDQFTNDLYGRPYQAHATLGAINCDNYSVTDVIKKDNLTKTTEGTSTVVHLFVDPAATVSNYDGRLGASWDTPLRYLNNALEFVRTEREDAANANTIYRIHIKQGTVTNVDHFEQRTTYVRSIDFPLYNNVQIYGGYSSGLTGTDVDAANRDPLKYPTVITAVTVQNDYPMNALHLLVVKGAQNVVVDGVELQFANAKEPMLAGADPKHYGGAILMEADGTTGSTATFRNIIIKGCTSPQGAAVWVGDRCKASFENTIIYNNESRTDNGQPMGTIYTEGSGSITFDHGDVLHNVGYAGLLNGDKCGQHYTNTVFHANVRKPLDDYRTESADIIPDAILPSFAYRSTASTTPSADAINAHGSHTDDATATGVHGSYCFFDVRSAALKGKNFDDLAASTTVMQQKMYQYQYGLSYYFDSENGTNGYPRFVNATRNCGVSPLGDVSFYGRGVSFEPDNMNPIVNAADNTAGRDNWGTDYTTHITRDYGGNPDVGAIENHADNSDAENAQPDGQPPYGKDIYVRMPEDGGDDNNDGHSWNNAVATMQRAMELAKQTGSVTKEPIEVPYTSFTRAADDANSLNTESWYQVKSAYRDYYWNAGTSYLQPTDRVGNNDGKDKSSDYESTFFQPVSVGDGTYYLQTRDGRYLYISSNNSSVQLSNSNRYRTPFNIEKSNGAWRIYRTTGWFGENYDYIDAYSAGEIHHTSEFALWGFDWSVRLSSAWNLYAVTFGTATETETVEHITYDASNIHVAAGTYDTRIHDKDKYSSSRFSSGGLHLVDGVNLYGGYPATGNPGEKERDLSNRKLSYTTTITANSTASDVNKSANRVLTQDADFVVPTMVEGFRITGGTCSGTNYGAGVFMRSNGTLKNCLVEGNTFTSNSSTAWATDGGGGGGVYCIGGTIFNCTVRRNTYHYGGLTGSGQSSDDISYNSVGGAGVFLEGGDIQNSLIVENTLDNSGTAIFGAGLFIKKPSRIFNTTIAYNRALLATAWQRRHAGGGAWDYSASKTLSTWQNCIVWGNMANGMLAENYIQVLSAHGSTATISNADNFNDCYTSAIRGYWTGKETPETVFSNDDASDTTKVYAPATSVIHINTDNGGGLSGYNNGYDNQNHLTQSTVNGKRVTSIAEINREYNRQCHINSPFKGDGEKLINYSNWDFTDDYKNGSGLTYELKDPTDASTSRYCINMGNSSDAIFTDKLTVDIVGDARIQDCQVDKGAYEYNGAGSITPEVFEPGKLPKAYAETLVSAKDTSQLAKRTTAVFYVTPNGQGTATASSWDNAACSMKLQNVLDAAGRYKFCYPKQRVIVKVATEDESLKFRYYANRTTRPDESDVRLFSIMVPRGVEVWGGYRQDANAKESGFDTTITVNNVATRFDRRDVKRHKTTFDANYVNTLMGTKAVAYHVITFTDRIFDKEGNAYTLEEQQQGINGYITPNGDNLAKRGGSSSYASLTTHFSYTEPQDYATYGDLLYRAVIDGIYVQGGRADIAIERLGSSNVLNPNRFGGAAIVKNYAHIRNCVLEDNRAYYGGALALMPGAIVSGTLIKGNSATEGGGAIYVFTEGDEVNLLEGSITVRTLPTDSDGDSPAANYDALMPHVYTSTIAQNYAQLGGGVCFTTDEANVRFNSTVIWQNIGEDGANIYGLYNPNTLESNKANIEYFPFAYSAAEGVRLTGVNNITLNSVNRQGTRFVDKDNDFAQWPKPLPTTDANYYRDVLHELPLGQQKIAESADKIDYYGITNYSVLSLAGMSIGDYRSLIQTKGLSAIDLLGTGRTSGYHADVAEPTYIDIGARAFTKETPHKKLMLQLYVTTPEQVNMAAAEKLMKMANDDVSASINKEQAENIRDYFSQEGSSFGYPMQSLQAALDYIREQRTKNAAGAFPSGVTNVNNCKFFIYLSGGTFYPSRDLEMENRVSSTSTFVIPEGVSIIGGFNPNETFLWDASKIDESTGSHFQRVANTLSETDSNGKNVLSFVGGFFAPIANPVSPGKDDATFYVDQNSEDYLSKEYYSGQKDMFDDNGKLKPENMHLDFTTDGTTFRMMMLHPDTLTNLREHSDVNNNNIIEPWEFVNQTILDGNVANIAEQGVHHVITVAPAETLVGMLPSPIELYDGYTNDGYHSRMLGQYIALNGLTIQGGRARGWDDSYANHLQEFSYYHGGAILVDGNIYDDGNAKDDERANPDKLGGDYYLHAGASNTWGYRDIPFVALNCRFVNNQAGYGGAISTNSSLELMNCSFEQNMSVGGTDNLDKEYQIGLDGKEIRYVDGKGESKDPISEVSYPGQGGAIYSTKQLTAYNTIFANNEARATMDESENNDIELKQCQSFRRSNSSSNRKELLGGGGVAFIGLHGFFHFINCDMVNNMANAYPVILTRNPNVNEKEDLSIRQYSQILNSVVWGNRLNNGVMKNSDLWNKTRTTEDGKINDPYFGQRLKYNAQLICNVGRLRTLDELEKNATATTDDYNYNDNIFDILTKMDAPYDESMFYDADGKRRFGEAAWYSAYEKDRSLPAQNNYETYLDMPFDYNQHIVHQLNDWNPETSSGGDKGSRYQNCNVMISSDNTSYEGPNFGNPSGSAGFDGYNESADWSPSRMNVLTDAGSGKLVQKITNSGNTSYGATFTPDADGTYTNGTGVYVRAKYDNWSSLMRRFLPIGNDRYMLSTYTNKPGYTLIPRISQDPNPSHNRTYIDIGVYEYRHRPLQPQVTDGVDIIWVSSKEKADNGLPLGSDWSRPSTDLQRAIETLLSSRNGHRKEIRLMGGDYTPNYTINGHTAFYIDTRLLNSTTMLGSATEGTAVTGEGVTSLCIRGGYSHDLNGAYDIKEYPAVIHQRQRTNDKSSQWDHLFYINDASQRYGYDTYNKSNQFGQQGKDVSKPVTSIPIEIYGVTMQNDQTNKDVLGSVIYYPDAMGANPVSDTDPTKLDKAPEIDGTSESYVTWTERIGDNTANSSYQSNTAKVAAGQIPKLILGSDIIFGSGNEADFNPSASATQRQKASAVYIGATGGHALIYNNVFHSNQAHPLITKAPTRIVNSTFALNGMEVVMDAAGDADTQRNDTLKSRVFNSVFWRNNPTTTTPAANSDYGNQFIIRGIDNTLLTDTVTTDDKAGSENRFERNCYTGGYTESTNYDSNGELAKRRYNTGLAYENTDLMNGPNFVLPFNDDRAKRNFTIQPSQRLVNKGNDGRYVMTYNTAVGADNSNFVYDFAWVQKKDTVVSYDGQEVTISKDYEQRNGPQFDAGYRDRFSHTSHIDIGAYEYQNVLRRVLYVDTRRIAETGESWERPLNDIQNAVDLAALYHTSHPRQQAYVFVKSNEGSSSAVEHTHQGVLLREGVSIYGGMSGSGLMRETLGKTADDNYYEDRNIIDYLNEVERNDIRTPVGGLGFNKTVVSSIRTSDQDRYAPFDHLNKYTDDDQRKGLIPEGKHVGDQVASDPRLQVRTLIDGFAVMPDGNASPQQSPIRIRPVLKDSVAKVITIDSIIVRHVTMDGEKYYVERLAKTPGDQSELKTGKDDLGGEYSEGFKQYHPYPSLALRNIIVADWKMPANVDVAYVDQALIYGALFRDNTTSGTGASLRLGSRGYAMCVTATGKTVGSDGSTTLNNLTHHYRQQYDCTGTGRKDHSFDLECNLHRGTSHLYFCLTNFDNDKITQASLLKGHIPILTAAGVEDPNLMYQFLDTSPYIDLDVYSINSELYSSNDPHKKSSEYLKTTATSEVKWLSQANPDNFLPLNLRDFVHLRDDKETVNTRPSDTDLLGNPRFPEGITGANDKLDRGCFETWWQRSTYVTNKELGRYPHPGSAVYLLNRYAYHPSHVDNVSKIYNDADMDISLVLDVSISPGLIFMQQGTSLYGNGHGIHTKTMAFERTVDINKGTIVALPYAMDYGAENCIWDVTNYGGSQKQKVLAEVDHDRAAKDLIYGYNAVQRSQWNNIFEPTNSSKWTLLSGDDRRREAAHGVLIMPKDPMKVSYENDTITHYQAAVNAGVRTYRFIGVARDASWAYAEEDGATTKTVTLHQRDDYTSTDNAADFTNKEDMGWNLIGLPYAVNTYYTHRRQTAMGDYTMNVPHTLWMYFDGDYTMMSHDMANTNFVNDVFEQVQKAVDERRKSKGGYYPVKAWSENWDDWNQLPIQYPMIGVYDSKRGGKKDEKSSKDIVTYILTDTVITANPRPRIWMGEGFFTQTAAVNGDGTEELSFSTPLYVPNTNRVQALSSPFTVIYDKKTGLRISDSSSGSGSSASGSGSGSSGSSGSGSGSSGSGQSSPSGSPKGPSGTRRDRAAAQRARYLRAVNDAMWQLCGSNYRLYGGMTGIDDPQEDETMGGIVIRVHHRNVTISGLKVGDMVDIYDPAGRIYNMRFIRQIV